MKRWAILFIVIFFFTSAQAGLVVNPGFETMESIGSDLPDTYGDWDGDDGTIVNGENGIIPFEGKCMLRFDAVSQSGASWGNTCEIYQILDVSGYEDLISSGSAIVCTSAYFNRVLGDDETDTKFGLYILAYDGSPSTFPSRWISNTYDSSLDWTAEGIFSDSNSITWEEISFDMQLPIETTFLVVKIAAREDVFNDYSYPEFDGHFADAVSVVIVSEPGIPVSVDIKPSDCPNPLSVKSRGVLPVAILGTEDFDVSSIDLTSIRLAGVAPVRSSFEDVATPVSDLNDCACSTEEPDGFTDLVLKFRTPEIVAAIADSCGPISKGDEISLTLIGTLSSEQSITGSDCVVIIGKVPRELTAMRSDVNKDGIINYLDFAWIAEYWLEPAFVE